MFDPSISLSQLESHLWEAAKILRGPIDAGDFKTYVLFLLFFKHICDVPDEEYKAALEKSGGNEDYALFLQNYGFQIPPDCHFSEIRKVTSNIGVALQKAMRCIEAANPESIYGIFCDILNRLLNWSLFQLRKLMKQLCENTMQAFAKEEKLFAILEREGLVL